jgi:hypothetical protein
MMRSSVRNCVCHISMAFWENRHELDATCQELEFDHFRKMFCTIQVHDNRVW